MNCNKNCIACFNGKCVADKCCREVSTLFSTKLPQTEEIAKQLYLMAVKVFDEGLDEE